MAGWILLHRSILKHWVWLSPLHTQRWLYILLNAAYEERAVEFSNKKLILKRGQLLTTYRQLQADWKTSSDVVNSFLKALERNEMINLEPTKDWTLITVCNYDKYQGEQFSPQSDENNVAQEPYHSHQPTADLPTDSDPYKQGEAKRSSIHSKRNKEDNNINNNQNYVDDERAKRFFDDFLSELKIEQGCKSFRISKETYIELAKEIFHDWQFKEEPDWSYGHFWNTLNKKVQSLNQKSQNDGKTGSKPRRNTQRGESSPDAGTNPLDRAKVHKAQAEDDKHE